MKDINLIPKSYFLNKKKKRIRFYLITVGFVLIGFFIATFFIPIIYENKYKRELELIIEKDEQTLEYVEKSRILDSFQDIYEKRKKKANEINSFDNQELKLFEAIELARPNNLFVTSFKMTGDALDKRKVVLDCISNTDSQAAAFVENLRKNEFFESIILNSITMMGNGQSTSTVVDNSKDQKTVDKTSKNSKTKTTATIKPNIESKDKYSFVIEIYY